MQIKRKPYPMPKICKMLLNIEGFKYVISLDLNMDYYYRMHLSKKASNKITNITPWGKYRHKHILMGVRNPRDILQEKMNKMFHVFEFIESYINELLIITNGDRSNQSENLERTIKKLKDNRLQCNIKNLSLDRLKCNT